MDEFMIKTKLLGRRVNGTVHINIDSLYNLFTEIAEQCDKIKQPVAAALFRYIRDELQSKRWESK